MAERAAPDVSSLGQDLDAAQRRRLWLLAQIIQDLGIDDIALTLNRAEQLENFVVNGFRSDAARRPPAHLNGGCATERDDEHEADRAAPDAWDREQSPPPLLDEETRRRFIDEAVRDPDNRRLAQMFGLSVRQAHAVRVAFRKVIARRRQTEAVPEVAARNDVPEPRAPTNGVAEPSAPIPRDGAASPPRPAAAAFVVRSSQTRGHARRCAKRMGLGLDRETELRMEAEFLAGKRPADPTMDDVVRFLRQLGDVVVSEEGGYVVNYSDRITAEQLVERANDKRRRRGQQAFVIARAAGGTKGSDHLSEPQVDLPAHTSG